MIYFPEYCVEEKGRYYTPFYHLGQWGISVRGRDVQNGKEVNIKGSDPSIEYVGRMCNIPPEDILMLKLTYSY